jgi:CheY-like chemotaxis protein
VITLEQALTSSRGIELIPGSLPPELGAALHPSVLRQILVMSVGQLVDQMSRGRITIGAQSAGRHVQLTLTCEPRATATGMQFELLREVLATQGGSLEIIDEARRTSLRIELPYVGEVAVLVVDDNPDMRYLYRRCVKRTRYRIVHEGSGRRMFEAVQAHAPDVIVLDIMLPDVDGWQLLSDLHHHHATRHIPVMVCSVIDEENLALALGASLFLPKPVDCRSFIQALEQVLQPAPAAATTEPASNGAAD